MSAAPSALTVQQGQSGTVTVTLTRGGGFTGSVDVSVSGLPAGVTVSVNPTTLTGATTSAVVTVNVAASTVPGTYTATIRATSTGVGEATATYQLTVTAIPNYALSATPAAVSVPQGVTGTTTVNIARTNFTGAVALTLDSPPAGITGTFNPASATGDNSTLTIAVATTVATGNYTLTVKGSASGPGDKTTTVALTVTTQPNISLTFSRLAMTITAGRSDTGTVTITRTNYTGPVTLSLVSPPTGVTGTFTFQGATGTTAVLTLAVANTVAAGNYQITVRGSAPGVPGAAVGEEDVAAVSAVADRDIMVMLTVLPVPDFALAALPTALSIGQGGSGTTAITITRTNLPDPVSLTLDNPPAGISGVFTPAGTTGGTSSLQVNVAVSVPPGNYTVTVKGTSGALSKTTTVAVTVVAGPNVNLSLTPATLSVAAGGSSGTSTLSINRTNYTATVTPQAAGQPAGMTIGFTPASTTGNSLTITVSAGAGVLAGTYNVTISAPAAPGSPSTVLQVTVTAPVGTAVDWLFCGTQQVPDWFGVKSGAATTFTQVMPTVTGGTTKFSFVLTGTQGSLASVAFTIPSTAAIQDVVPDRTWEWMGAPEPFRQAQRNQPRAPWMARASSQSTVYTTFMINLALNEAAALGTGNNCPVEPTTQVQSRTATNFTLLDKVQIAYRRATSTHTVGVPTVNTAVEIGVSDVFATRDALASGTPFYGDLFFNQSSASPITINAGTLPALLKQTATFTGFPVGGMQSNYMGLNTTTNGEVGLISGGFPTSSSTYDMFRTSNSPAGVMWRTGYNVFQSQGGLTTVFSGEEYLGQTFGAKTIALPPVPAVVFTQLSPSPVRWGATGPIISPFIDQPISVSFVSQATVAAGNLFALSATANWLDAQANTSAFNLAMPDFTGSGYPAAANLTLPLALAGATFTARNFIATPAAGSFHKFVLYSVQNP